MINTFYCIILFLLINFSTLYACSCSATPSFDYGKFEASPIIYLGIISAIDTIVSPDEKKFRPGKAEGVITVIERFKGDPGVKPIMVGAVMDGFGGECAKGIPINTYMIIYQDEKGKTFISSCSMPELVKQSSPLISVYRYMGQQKTYDTLSITFQWNHSLKYKDTTITSPFSFDAYILRNLTNEYTSLKYSEEERTKNRNRIKKQKKSFIPFRYDLYRLCKNRVCKDGSTEITVLFKGYAVSNGFFPLHYTVTASNMSIEWVSDLPLFERGPYKPISEREEFELYNPVYSYYFKERFKFEKIYYSIQKYEKLLVYGYRPLYMLGRINGLHSYKERNPDLGDYGMKRYTSP